MPFQWYRHTPNTPDESAQQEGILKRLVGAILKPWEKIKHYGKALVGGAIYYYGNRIFWGGETSRYLYKRYRTIFQRMGFVRQAILAYVHRIAAELPKVLSSSKQIMSLLEFRLKQVGLWEYYPEIVQDLLEFGDSFSEIIYSKPDFRVIGLKRLEPDYMYIQRDPYGRALLYISVIDGIPVTIEPYRMMHIKLNPQPGDAFGVGLIEGGMDDLAALRILEDLNIQLVKHNIYPHRVYMCPSNDIVAEVERKIQEQKRFGDLVVPMGVKAQQMIAGTGIDLRGFMLYYQQKFFLDVGVPMDMLIKGTGGNRSTAEEMNSAFNGNARAIQRQILVKLEWFCELVLASEGIVAAVQLVAPEIDKSLEFARRQEIRQIYQEGLISRDFAQELLNLKHPLNVLKLPEDFMQHMNQEKNWMEMFKLGLLTRPYAIKLLGHDVPENRPSQPQSPAFMMPMPGGGSPGGAPGGQSGSVAGVPLGNPDDPDMIDPSQAQVVGGDSGGESADGASPGAPPGAAPPDDNGGQPGLPLQKPQQVGRDTISWSQRQSINTGNQMEGMKMAKPVQTIYIRKVNENGEIENVPYAVTDPRSIGKSGNVVADPRKSRKDEVPTTAATTGVTASDNKLHDPKEEPLKPTSNKSPADGQATPVDGDNGGIQTEPNRVSNDPNKPIDPRSGTPMNQDADGTVTAPRTPEDQEDDPNAPQADTGEPQEAQAPAPAPGQPAPKMPKPAPYFAPIDQNGQARPKFADIFGDNEYSIKQPQRHVERIREEMMDPYGQKHKRIHERVREHHKPQNDSDFIERKKSSAQRKWMKKPASKVKNSADTNIDDYILSSIDVPLNTAAKPWIIGAEDVVLTAIETINRRVISAIKACNKSTFSVEDTLVLSNIVTKEVLTANEHVSALLPEMLENIYSAGINYMNEAFASNVAPGNTDSIVNAAIGNFVDRCVMYMTTEATAIVENLKAHAAESTDIVLAMSSMCDMAAMRAKSMIVSLANVAFRDAVRHVLTAKEIAGDVASVEFIVVNGDMACMSCKAHNMKNVPVSSFDFEACRICDVVYRIHINE